MAATDVVVRFVGDTSKLRGEVTKLEGTGSKIRGWARGVGLAIGGAFALDFAKDSIKAASDLGETMNKTNVVFGESADEVTKWSENAAEKLGMSQQAALGAASTFGDMFSQLGYGADQGAAASEQMVQLASDLGSFHNVDPSDVLERLGSAFRGEYDSIQKLIPGLTAARVEQEALGMTGKQSADDLTAMDKALATQAILMKDSTNATGDFAETSDSLANQQRIQAATMTDAQAKLGGALAGVLEKMMPVITAVTDWAAKNPALVAGIAGLAAALWLVNAAMAANPAVLVIAGIAALVAGLVIAYHKFDWFRTAVDAAWQALQAAFNWVKANWPLLLAILTGPIGLAVLAITRNWDTIKTAAAALYNKVREWLTKIATFFSDTKNKISGYVSNITGFFTNIGNAAKTAYEKVKEWIGKIATYIEDKVESVRTAAGNIVNAIKNPINSLIGGINSLRIPGFSVNINMPGPVPDIGFSWGGQDLFPHIPTLAKGGIVRSPTLAMIGEAGPEAVVPLGRTIGNTYHITVQVPPTADPTAVGRATVDAIQAYERRNGNTWRAA